METQTIDSGLEIYLGKTCEGHCFGGNEGGWTVTLPGTSYYAQVYLNGRGLGYFEHHCAESTLIPPSKNLEILVNSAIFSSKEIENEGLSSYRVINGKGLFYSEEASEEILRELVPLSCEQIETFTKTLTETLKKLGRDKE